MDNIFFVFILFSIVSSILQGIKKKQSGQQKKQAEIKTPGNEPFSADKKAFFSVTQKTEPLSVKPLLPNRSPAMDRSTQKSSMAAERQETEYEVMEPRGEERMTVFGEGVSGNDLVRDRTASVQTAIEEAQPDPAIPLNFDGKSFLSSIVMSEILKHPWERFHRRSA